MAIFNIKTDDECTDQLKQKKNRNAEYLENGHLHSFLWSAEKGENNEKIHWPNPPRWLFSETWECSVVLPWRAQLSCRCTAPARLSFCPCPEVASPASPRERWVLPGWASSTAPSPCWRLPTMACQWNKMSNGFESIRGISFLKFRIWTPGGVSESPITSKTELCDSPPQNQPLPKTKCFGPERDKWISCVNLHLSRILPVECQTNVSPREWNVTYLNLADISPRFLFFDLDLHERMLLLSTERFHRLKSTVEKKYE